MTSYRPLPSSSPPTENDSLFTPKRTRARWPAALWIAASLAIAACDGAGPSVDASAPVSARTAAVSVRIDVVPGKPASLSVLAFRAAFSGVPAADILGLVDPMAADAPLHDCKLRDADQAAAALVARGDGIELEELTGVGISLGEDAGEIRPSPRLYPDLAATIGGVVAEAGPLGLSAMPEALRVHGGAVAPGDAVGADETGDRATDRTVVSVPTTGWVRLLNGVVPRDGLLISTAGDLTVALEPDQSAQTSIELRPFGATVALSCTVPRESTPSGGQLTYSISRDTLAALMAASGATPGASIAAGLDLVRRSNGQLPLSLTRVALEVRTSTFVELHP